MPTRVQHSTVFAGIKAAEQRMRRERKVPSLAANDFESLVRNHFGKATEAAIDELLAVVTDGGKQDRRLAMRCLRYVPIAKRVRPKVAACLSAIVGLDDSSSVIRFLAADTLHHLGTSTERKVAEDAITKVFTEADFNERVEFAIHLASVGKRPEGVAQEVITALDQAWRDQDLPKAVRHDAIRALHELACDVIDKPQKNRNSLKYSSPKTRGRGKQGVDDVHDGSPLELPPRELLVNHDQFSTLLNSPLLSTIKQSQAALAYIRKATSRSLREPQRQLKQYLQQLHKVLQAKPEGERNFGNFEANRLFAANLRDRLNSLELRLKCPTCGRPSRLICFKPQHGFKGAFRFDHNIDGERSSHATSVDLPKLEAVRPGRDLRRVGS